jgi:hypothetical protein
MSTKGNSRAGSYAARPGAARLPATGEALKGKRIGLVLLAVSLAAMWVPTPAAAVDVGFGGIRIRVPGVIGVPGGQHYHHNHDYAHHGRGRHHSHDEEGDSADLTKGRSDHRGAGSKLDSGAKATVDKADVTNAIVNSEAGAASNASAAPKPAPALASDVPTAEARMLNELNPDLTPER